MTLTVTPPTFQFSELSRNAKAVASATVHGPVTIKRRNGEPLVLARQSDIESDRTGVEMAARIVTAISSSDSIPIALRLDTTFPWMKFLSSAERDELVRDVISTLNACAAVTRFEPLLVCVAAWKDTARAYAEGWRNDQYLEWIDDPIPVERPENA